MPREQYEAAQVYRAGYFSPNSGNSQALSNLWLWNILRAWYQWRLRKGDILEAQRCNSGNSSPFWLEHLFRHLPHCFSSSSQGDMPSGPPPSFSQTSGSPSALNRVVKSHLPTVFWESTSYYSPLMVPPQKSGTQKLTTYHSSHCIKQCRFTTTDQVWRQLKSISRVSLMFPKYFARQSQNLEQLPTLLALDLYWDLKMGLKSCLVLPLQVPPFRRPRIHFSGLTSCSTWPKHLSSAWRRLVVNVVNSGSALKIFWPASPASQINALDITSLTPSS